MRGGLSPPSPAPEQGAPVRRGAAERCPGPGISPGVTGNYRAQAANGAERPRQEAVAALGKKLCSAISVPLDISAVSIK